MKDLGLCVKKVKEVKNSQNKNCAHKKNELYFYFPNMKTKNFTYVLKEKHKANEVNMGNNSKLGHKKFCHINYQCLENTFKSKAVIRMTKLDKKNYNCTECAKEGTYHSRN